MLDGSLLDKLDSIARRVRGKPDEPMGGIQLLLTGDFFQVTQCLPCIPHC